MSNNHKLIAVAALLATTQIPLPALAQDANTAFVPILQQSMKEKRGIIVFLNGETVSGAVVNIEGTQWVELRSQQYSRIIVRMDRINAVAVP
jgi:hypothetical protein